MLKCAQMHASRLFAPSPTFREEARLRLHLMHATLNAFLQTSQSTCTYPSLGHSVNGAARRDPLAGKFLSSCIHAITASHQLQDPSSACVEAQARFSLRHSTQSHALAGSVARQGPKVRYTRRCRRRLPRSFQGRATLHPPPLQRLSLLAVLSRRAGLRNRPDESLRSLLFRSSLPPAALPLFPTSSTPAPALRPGSAGSSQQMPALKHVSLPPFLTRTIAAHEHRLPACEPKFCSYGTSRPPISRWLSSGPLWLGRCSLPTPSMVVTTWPPRPTILCTVMHLLHPKPIRALEPTEPMSEGHAA